MVLEVVFTEANDIYGEPTKRRKDPVWNQGRVISTDHSRSTSEELETQQLRTESEQPKNEIHIMVKELKRPKALKKVIHSKYN